MAKCENCILLKCNNIVTREALDDAYIENGFLRADIELLKKDLKEAYNAIIAIMHYEACVYGMQDIYEKARLYLDEHEENNI